MPSCLMILPNLSASARVNVASSLGLDLAVSTAMSSIRFFTSGRNRIRPISALTLATISLDMPVPSQNFIRSRNLGHYRPKCGPKQDRNLNSLFGREDSLFFAENSLFTPKNFPACSTRRSNFVTAWLYQSSRAIGISHMRHDQATFQPVDSLPDVVSLIANRTCAAAASAAACVA